MVIIESDNSSTINCIKVRRDDITTFDYLVNIIKEMVRDLPNFRFEWNGQENNRVVDSLSNLALQDKCNVFFDMDYLGDIHN